jgi:hypothetical protein
MDPATGYRELARLYAFAGRAYDAAEARSIWSARVRADLHHARPIDGALLGSIARVYDAMLARHALHPARGGRAGTSIVPALPAVTGELVA